MRFVHSGRHLTWKTRDFKIKTLVYIGDNKVEVKPSKKLHQLSPGTVQLETKLFQTTIKRKKTLLDNSLHQKSFNICMICWCILSYCFVDVKYAFGGPLRTARFYFSALRKSAIQWNPWKAITWYNLIFLHWKVICFGFQSAWRVYFKWKLNSNMCSGITGSYCFQNNTRLLSAWINPSSRKPA